MPTDSDPGLTTLIAGVVSDVRTLIRGEIELAKSELNRSAKRGATGAGLVGLAIFLALFALLMLAFSAAYGLVAAGLDPWQAFLIIAGVMLLITAILVFVAVRQFKKVRGPVEAQREAQKTARLLSEHKAAAARARGAAQAEAQAAKVATAAGKATSAPESTTVFPSYGGEPPTP